eukprot:3935905-Rhodomonas_salina.2
MSPVLSGGGQQRDAAAASRRGRPLCRGVTQHGATLASGAERSGVDGGREGGREGTYGKA